MTQPYYSIIEYEEDDWGEFLERVCLIEIFKPVIEYYKDIGTLKCVIRYIVYAYSLESDKVILGMEWQKNKQHIFEFVLAKPIKDIYEELVLLKNPSVVAAIHNWLEFGDNDTFKQLSSLKDLRVEMQLSSVSAIKKPSMEIDYDQKFKNAEYSAKLKIMISDLESELIQNNHKLKEGVKEIKTAQNKKNSRSVGSYAVRG